MKLLPILALLFPAVNLQAGGFTDNFSDPKLEIRQALRGEWIYKDGVDSCVSDPELYKALANHGPILRWPASFTDGSVEFEVNICALCLPPRSKLSTCYSLSVR